MDTCDNGNDYNGRLGLRIASVFVIMFASTFGAFFPIITSRNSKLSVLFPDWAFFFAKYFGSGVIVATSMIHLLQPANEALTDPCLPPAWQVYPYAFGISLFTLFCTFFMELVSMRVLKRMGMTHDHGPTSLMGNSTSPNETTETSGTQTVPFPRGTVAADSKDVNEATDDAVSYSSEASHGVASQLGAIMFLEFGIVFHSVFIGLTLAVSGEEFNTLFIVIIFHQMFEGFGLGTRIAMAPWPADKQWIPWVFAAAYGVTTPLAIAIGLGVRTSYPPNSQRSLITNGIFDSISSGILIYVGLVELVANEFMHSKEFAKAPLSRILKAFFIMVFGAGIMALLGRWA